MFGSRNGEGRGEMSEGWRRKASKGKSSKCGCTSLIN